MRLDFNFASRDYMLARKLYGLFFLGILACAAVFVLLSSGYRHDLEEKERLGLRLAGEEQALGEARERLDGYARSIDKDTVKTAYSEAAFANSAIIRKVFSWTLFLNRFEELVPEGVGITGIKPNFQSLDVDLSGTARDIGRLTEFIDRLTRSRYFGDIPPSFTANESVLDLDVGKPEQVFSLKIRYIPDPDAGLPEELTGGEN